MTNILRNTLVIPTTNFNQWIFTGLWYITRASFFCRGPNNRWTDVQPTLWAWARDIHVDDSLWFSEVVSDSSVFTDQAETTPAAAVSLCVFFFFWVMCLCVLRCGAPTEPRGLGLLDSSALSSRLDGDAAGQQGGLRSIGILTWLALSAPRRQPCYAAAYAPRAGRLGRRSQSHGSQKDIIPSHPHTPTKDRTRTCRWNKLRAAGCTTRHRSTVLQRLLDHRVVVGVL